MEHLFKAEHKMIHSAPPGHHFFYPGGQPHISYPLTLMSMESYYELERF